MRRCIVSSLFIAGAIGLPAATSQTTNSVATDFAAIDAYLEAEMRADRVPGVALAIVHGEQIVYLRGFGNDGTGKSVTPQTTFILGSMSKAFTALAIMQLVEQGKIELDKPVQHYLPWFCLADIEASKKITVRHLLHHTSGIPEKAPQASDAPLSIEAHVRALANVAPNHAAGEIHEYASPNYLVLGALIEQLSGQSYAEYVQNNIFTPLAMSNSFTSQITAMQATMARGHRYCFGFPQPTVLRYEADRMPTAALISSAEDLAHFMIAQLNQGRFNNQPILSPAGIEEMHRPAIQSAGFAYAMGWRVSELNGATAIHHGGIVPHFRGKMVMLPQEKWGVAVLTNVSSILPASPASHRMADNIAGALTGKSLPAAGSPLTRIYWGITLGIAILTFKQLKEIFTIKHWRAQLSGKSARSLWLGLGVDLLMPVIVLIGLPRLLRVPLFEMLRAMPDVGYWLIASAVLGFAVALFKMHVVRQHFSSL